MPLDHYRTLGRSGLRVSPFCLGAMTFGEEWGYGSDAAGSMAVIDRFFDLGGNFVDTANMYTNGHSEAIIGDWLARSPGKRDKLVLATKFSGNLRYGDPNGGGAGRKSIIAACEESLRRLRTDYIDLYWMHWWDVHTPIEETMDALDDLVREGKVRYLGFSDTPAWKVAEAQVTARLRGWAPLIGLQIEYSLLERTVEGELIPMALDMGLGVTPWSPLRAGALSGKYTRERREPESSGRAPSLSRNLNDAAFDVIEELATVAADAVATSAQVALAWLLSKPGVVSPIMGARTLSQLEDNLAALDLALTPAQLDRLDKASNPSLDFPAAMVVPAQFGSYGNMTIDGRTYPAGLRSVKPDDRIW